MTAATLPRPAQNTRLLVLRDGQMQHRSTDDLPSLLGAGDVLVVNDAATLPASLHGTVRGQPIEVRLAEAPHEGLAWAVTFGPGDWRLPTELRVVAPALQPGDRIVFPGGRVHVVAMDGPRLVQLRIDPELIYRQGRPVQYSYVSRELALHEVQTPFAGRPWAVEMPSAGRPLTLALRQRIEQTGARIVALTHGAGLSSTGDRRLDERLPLPERFAVPESTWAMVRRARRVVAVGTSVVRALESVPMHGLAGTTDLVVEPNTRLAVVHGLLSGMHEPGESHFRMMGAFADVRWLAHAARVAATRGYRNHEFGDCTLLL
jgi:S-adenosylmethionine:tRNA ribosyltransferase-isomerase